MIRLKDPNATIYSYGWGEINAANITQELYDKLIAQHPSMADLFIVDDDDDWQDEDSEN
jgi:hypothetical protein